MSGFREFSFKGKKSKSCRTCSPPPPSPPQFLDAPPYTKPTDKLPGYSPSLQLCGLALLKTEFLSPFHSSKDRSWKPVVLELNSTQLNMYEVDTDIKCLDVILALYNEVNLVQEAKPTTHNDMDSDEDGDFGVADLDYEQQFIYQQTRMAKLRQKHKKARLARKLGMVSKYYTQLKDNGMLFEPQEVPRHGCRGKLIQSYTLANMQVGVAPCVGSSEEAALAHIRYKNTLRVRLEYKQVLLQMWSFHGMVEWMRALNIGKDLSMPLESRRETRMKSIPGRSNINNLLASISETSVEDRKPAIAPKEPRCSFSSADSCSECSVFSSLSQATSATAISNYCEKTSISINNHTFYSLENVSSEAEKQFIDSCLPRLNSGEKWNGREMTISNFSKLLGRKQRKSDAELLIEYSNLERLVHALEKDTSGSNECRSFFVHTSGFVSVI